MKPYSFLFIDTYYPDFLDYFYWKNKKIVNKNYDEQKATLIDELFGTSNFYSSNLTKLGYKADNIVINNEILQKQWAKEHKINFNDFPNSYPVRHFSFLKNFVQKKPQFYYWIKDFIREQSWTYQILMAQIKEYQPDVLYVLDISFLSPSFLKEAKQYVKMIVGQIACPVPPKKYLKPYNLVLSAAPGFVERFKKIGINSEYLKLAFEPRILEKIIPQEKKYQCTFIGGISRHHTNITPLLEDLSRRIKIDFWGYGVETLDESSPIILRHHGPVWGRAMYKILSQSKITINRHIDVAENYAGNMRLYETTGMGTMLITDMKDNLGELFEIGKEVVAYKNVNELVDLIKYYSQHDREREKIAQAGQKRTFREHTYYNRMKEFLYLIENKYM